MRVKSKMWLGGLRNWIFIIESTHYLLFDDNYRGGISNEKKDLPETSFSMELKQALGDSYLEIK